MALIRVDVDKMRRSTTKHTPPVSPGLHESISAILILPRHMHMGVRKLEGAIRVGHPHQTPVSVRESLDPTKHPVRHQSGRDGEPLTSSSLASA